MEKCYLNNVNKCPEELVLWELALEKMAFINTLAEGVARGITKNRILKINLIFESKTITYIYMCEELYYIDRMMI